MKMNFNEMTKRQINKHFRNIDDSDKWPIRGKFNATERAIRRIRKLFPEIQGLEYALTLESEISRIVNKEV